MSADTPSTSGRKHRSLYGQSATPPPLGDRSFGRPSDADGSLDRHSSSHAAQSAAATTVRTSSAGSPTQVTKSSTVRVPLRRDHLASRAMGLAEPIPLKRAAQPSSTSAHATRATKAERPLWNPFARVSRSPKTSGKGQYPQQHVDAFASPTVSFDTVVAAHREAHHHVSGFGAAAGALSAAVPSAEATVKVIITARGDGPTLSSFVRDPIEQCVVVLGHQRSRSHLPRGTDDDMLEEEGTGSLQYACDAAFLTDTEREEMGSRLAETIARDSTFRGVNAVMIAIGAMGSGKTYTMYGSNGASRQYAHMLLDELQRTFLAKLWSVQISIVNVVDGNVFDALPTSLHARRAAAQDASAFELSALLGSSDSLSAGYPQAHGQPANLGAPAEMLEPKVLFDRLAVIIRDHEDVDEMFDEIVSRSSARHNVTWQEVVHIAVVPCAGVQQTFSGLMKSVGNACFVEVGAGMSNDREMQSNTKAANAQRHTATTMMNVLNALTRISLRNNSNSNSASGTLGIGTSGGYVVHVPYADAQLTSLLEPLLSAATILLVAHVQDAPEERVPSLSTLNSVDQIMRHRFPNGRPPVNYKSVARAQCLKAEKIVREFESAKRRWNADREQMETERLMLQKAYDELQQQSQIVDHSAFSTTGASAVADTSHGAPVDDCGQGEASGRSAAHEKLESMKQSLQSLKAMLSTVQREKYLLEEQHTATVERCMVLEEELARAHAQRRRASVAELREVELHEKELGHALSDVLDHLSSAGAVLPIAPKKRGDGSLAELCLQLGAVTYQLTHQLCEREKAVETLLRIATRLDQQTQQQQQPLTLSPPLAGGHTRYATGEGTVGVVKRPASATNVSGPLVTPQLDIDGAPLLKWSAWRALLDRMYRHIDPLFALTPVLSPEATLAHFTGMLPKQRNRCGLSLFHFASSSSPSVFVKYWGSSEPFPAGKELAAAAVEGEAANPTSTHNATERTPNPKRSDAHPSIQPEASASRRTTAVPARSAAWMDPKDSADGGGGKGAAVAPPAVAASAELSRVAVAAEAAEHQGEMSGFIDIVIEDDDNDDGATAIERLVRQLSRVERGDHAESTARIPKDPAHQSVTLTRALLTTQHPESSGSTSSDTSEVEYGSYAR